MGMWECSARKYLVAWFSLSVRGSGVAALGWWLVDGLLAVRMLLLYGVC
jgi:hypothetical protein